MNLTLDIYLTDKCNMKCDYCYHRNYGIHSLGYNSLKQVIDYAIKNGIDSISFLGGEPFLEKEILIKSIKYINLKKQKTKIFLYTNGTLLNDETTFLNKNDVNVFLSLDGDFKTFISRRKIYHQNYFQKKIIYEKILNLGNKIKNNYIMIYIDNNSSLINKFSENIKSFIKNGFYNFGIEFERNCHWSRENLKNIEEQIKKVKEIIKKFPETKIININDAKERLKKVVNGKIWWGNCDKLILGADGKYYCCEKIFSFPQNLREKAVVGDIKNGVDFEKRTKMYREAKEYIISKIPQAHLYYYCPMGTYFINKWSNKDLSLGLKDLLLLSKQLYASFYHLLKI